MHSALQRQIERDPGIAARQTHSLAPTSVLFASLRPSSSSRWRFFELPLGATPFKSVLESAAEKLMNEIDLLPPRARRLPPVGFEGVDGVGAERDDDGAGEGDMGSSWWRR